ncbi:MAG TPA: hypothetical protein DCE42_12980 [Myxococcales bacterium]|nr:hypothetical protein [Deltaproteobacteria bacterium]MBU54473.1 hypothetical protein [Deltaproteobacteria bacterium]HAA55669.1 hypothetical protein [Myxococcales bacterium]
MKEQYTTRNTHKMWWLPIWGVGLALILGLACHSEAPHNDPFAKLTQPIIGGTFDTRHPAVGALVVQGNSFCTGTLIAQRVVLTAAHCIDAAKSYAGRSQLFFRLEFPDTTTTQGYRFESVEIDSTLMINHPKWNANASNGNDIGFAILKTKVTKTPIIPFNAAPLSQQYIGQKPLFLGYGLTQSVPNAVSATRKSGVELPIISVQTDRFSHQAPGKSVCHGDSGGPALLTINGQLRVIGVNSYVSASRVPNTNRSRCDASGTSMRTDTYAVFIRSILLKYGDGPASCTTDQECGACADCHTDKTCKLKTFTPETTTCQPCEKDADCGTGLCHRFPEGFRCIQPCNQGGCCPSGSFCEPSTNTNITGLCKPEKNTCPPVACTDDKGCGPGEICDTKAGTCKPDLPPRSPKLCHPCKSHADCDGEGYFCFGPQGNGQCTMPCGKADFCPEGFACERLYPGAPKQCRPTSGSCTIPCIKDEHCPTNFACNNGTCERKGGGEHGDSCDPMPCKQGLECVETVNGKHCMQPCGIPSGYAGGYCPADKQCKGDARCYTVDSQRAFCIAECKTDADCKAKGGGTCSQKGNCLCDQDSDCESGNFCNQSTGFFGACISKQLNNTCKTGFECRRFNTNQYCVPTGPGSRSLGEKCDSLNRCNDGLVCLGTEDGPTCFEPCSQNQPCKLGGQCYRYGRNFSVCLCTGADCPIGRACKPYLNGTHGVCQEASPQGPGRCIGDAECPPNYACQSGTCVAKPSQPEPTPEPVQPEPTPEPTTPDAGPEAKPEPIKEAPVAPEPKVEEKPKETTPTQDTLPAVPSGGCNCQTTTQNPSWEWPLWMLLMLFPLGWRRRRPLKQA